MRLELLSPWSLACLLVLVPLAIAAARVHRHQRRAATVLGMGSARSSAMVVWPALLASATVLVVLAASRPVLRTSSAATVMTDAQAYLVLDNSLSMLARPGRTGPARIDAARAVADRLLDRLPDGLPVGLAVMPQGVLPLLAPTTNRGLLRDVVDHVIEVGAVRLPAQIPLASGTFSPPNPKPFVATSMAALQTVVLARFFGPGVRHRLVLLLTDAETMHFDRAHVARLLRRSHVQLLVVRIGSTRDRLWRVINGSVRLDRNYRPPARSAQLVAALATTLHGDMYRPSQVGQIAGRIRRSLRSSARKRVGRTDREVALGPYAAVGGLILAAIVFGPALPSVRLRPVSPGTGRKRRFPS